MRPRWLPVPHSDYHQTEMSRVLSWPPAITTSATYTLRLLGSRLGTLGSAVLLPRSLPLQSLLGHTQSKPLSPAPTSQMILLSSPRARPDLAPDS